MVEGIWEGRRERGGDGMEDEGDEIYQFANVTAGLI